MCNLKWIRLSFQIMLLILDRLIHGCFSFFYTDCELCYIFFLICFTDTGIPCEFDEWKQIIYISCTA